MTYSSPTSPSTAESRQLLPGSWRLRSAVAAILLGVVVLSTPAALAIQINIHHDTGDDDNPVWDPDGSRLIAMFEAAAQIWEELLPGSGQHDVDVKWDDDFSALGQWNHDFEPFSHNNIRINPANPWFVDPTPLDHSEYDFSTQSASAAAPRTFFGGTWHFRDLTAAEQSAGFYGAPPSMLEVGFRGQAPTGSPLTTQFDLLSTVVHELGHELGVNSFNLGPGWDFESQWVGGVSGSGVRRTGGHLVPQTTLMCNACGLQGTRRLPSAADVLAVAEHHGHATVDLNRIEFISGTDWHVGTNWIGGNVPAADDDAFIRNPDVIATVGLSATARAQNLLLGQRAWLSTNAEMLRVGPTTGGTLTIDGANSDTTLFVNAGGTAHAGNIVLQRQGFLDMRGGETIVYDRSLNVSDSTSAIVGFGTITLFGAESLINDGLIEPRNTLLTLTAPFAGTFDLDGANGNGTLRVTQGNLTVDGPLRDAFDGTLSIAGGRTVTFNEGWELAGTGTVLSATGEAWIRGDTTLSGDLTTRSGEVLNLADSLTTTTSATMTVEAGAINVLRGSVTHGGGRITGAGTVRQESTAIVSTNTQIDVDTFDLDGVGGILGGEATTTIDGATLTIDSRAIDASPSAPGMFGGTLVIDGGSLVANIDGGNVDLLLSDSATIFEPEPSASLTLLDRGGSIPQYAGSRLVVGPNAVIDVVNAVTTGAEPIAHIDAETQFNTGTVNIDDQITLRLRGDNDFSGDTHFTGADGILALTDETQSRVTGTPTIDSLLSVRGLGPGTTGTRLTVSDGGLLRVRHRAEILGSGRLILENGTAHIGNVADGAELTIAETAPALQGHVEQTSGGKLVVSDLNFAASPNGFYVDGLNGATVIVEDGGSLETTAAQLASFAPSPGSGNVTVRGAGSRWHNHGSLYLGGSPADSGGDAELEIMTEASVVTGTDPGSEVRLFEGDRLNVIGGRLTVGAGPEAALNQIRINPGAQLRGELGQIRVGGGASSDGIASVAAGHGLILDDGQFQTDELSLRGDLRGTGTLVGEVTAFDSSTIEPGLPGGELVLEGDLDTTGELRIQLGGPSLGEFGQLLVNGSASIGGSSLQVDLIDLGGGTYEPLAGDVFEILFASDGILGNFASTIFPSLPDLGWSLFRDDVNILLEVVELLPADFDGNGIVDGEDFLRWQTNFGTTSGATRAMGDADGDGDVDGEDFLAWQTQFGSSTAGAGGGIRRDTAAIPEPATATLMVLALAAAVATGRSRAS